MQKTDLNKSLIRELQGDIGNDERPYLKIAKKLNISEKEVISQLEQLCSQGIIRRLGAVLRHHQAGMNANVMSVWKVPEQDTERVGNIIASFPEVSHCYERPIFPSWPYNLYGMIHAHNKDECHQIVQNIAKATGIKDYKMLFSIKELKKCSMKYY